MFIPNFCVPQPMRSSKGDPAVAFSPVFLLGSRLFRWGKYRCFVFMSSHHKMLFFFSVSSSRLSVFWKKIVALIWGHLAAPVGKPTKKASSMASCCSSRVWQTHQYASSKCWEVTFWCTKIMRSKQEANATNKIGNNCKQKSKNCKEKKRSCWMLVSTAIKEEHTSCAVWR